ncbi:putative alcohol O-acetyltransferase [Dioscorea sansibarensis]
MILRSPFKAPPLLLHRNSGINDSFIASVHSNRLRRRRLEIRAKSPFDENFLSLVPSLQSLLVTAAAALGAAFLISSDSFRRRADRDAEVDGVGVVGDWILFTSPTPFNRCVLLRCPSVSFEDGGELLDGLNDRLVREERHYVNLSRGLIPMKSREERDFVDEVCYQRVCVGTEDGGVLSLDLPENLDIGREHGLDTTVLIVPGTTEGSMDRNVRLFVHDALKHGYFPIVMNPRGCAGSPLTTARLFTAADSDDICTAIQYVKKARPWTTLMGVGWGYGANMLTKHLAEVGETTPLTAAVCIDNPFDLEEATRSFPHQVVMDQKLAVGLVDILRANKLFQGKTKRFDVTKALSATSLREFDTAVSMVSYGFDFIEDFYSNSSTRELVSGVKIPVLFIQSDDGTVPLFSIPRTLIAENPFTSLLLCSCLPSTIITSRRSSILWCQRLAIEWLTGVEFALLKGRHPLLKDVDITINPLKGEAFVRGGASETGVTTEKKIYQASNLPHLFVNNTRGNFFRLTQSNYVNGFLMNQNNSVFSESDGAIWKDVNDALKQNSSINADQDGGGDDSLDIEQSQVVQTAAVVMNMLDATVPDTLDDEQKKKVLTAIGQGETLMKALQGAVPEDVRGKLTSAVSEILQNQSTNLNIDALRRIGWVPKLAATVKSSVEEKLTEVSSSESSQSDTYFPEHKKRDADDGGGSQDLSDPKPGDNSTQESDSSFQDNNVQVSEHTGVDSEVGGKSSQDVKFDEGDESLEEIGEQPKISQKDSAADGKSADSQMNVNDAQNSDLKGVDSITKPNMANSSNDFEGTPASASSTSDQQAINKMEIEVQKSAEKTNQNMTDQTSQSPSLKAEEPIPQLSSPKEPSINVSEALDALTGFDDSTQIAVNSVFEVLEDMIDHFEKASNQGNADGIDENASQQLAPALEDSPSTGSYGTEKINNRNDVMEVEENEEQSYQGIEDSLHEDGAGSSDEFEKRYVENKVEFNPSSSSTKSVTQLKGNSESVNHLDEKNTDAGKNIDKIRHVSNFPMNVTVNPPWMSPYGNYLYWEYSVPLPVVQSLDSDSDSATDLVLDTEAGQWKMLDQSNLIGGNGENEHVNQKGHSAHYSYQSGDGDEIVEPSYVIVDTEYSGVQSLSTEELGMREDSSKTEETKRDELTCLVRDDLLEALKVEVGRQLAIPVLEDTESDLVGDLETVADAVSKSVAHDNKLNLNLLSKSNGIASEKFGVIEGECIVRTIFYAIQHTSHLRKVLPVGVIVGTSLASLRKFFQVAALHDEGHSEPSCDNGEFTREKTKVSSEHFVGANNHGGSDKSSHSTNTGLKKSNLDGGNIMVGAVTAALGASALVAQHQKNSSYKQDGALDFPSRVSNNRELLQKVHNKLEEEEEDPGKTQNNLVSSLAEKAMSVAGPVVPTNSDGEVDQERLVAILAELGQKGGMLRLVGKIALLWGGIRGAMNLTDRLISFLHIADRPLVQRVFGFVCMALVLWSPVVIPLLPTLVQSWTTKAPNVVAEYACIVGFYVATTILVMLWGKRIRGYENPVEQYGLDLTSQPRIHDFLKGLVGGIMMVLSIHSTNALLGYAKLSWPSALPSSSAGAALLLTSYGNMLILVIRGTLTAFGIALVEELLFRSWLLEEVAADLGYHCAIIISSLAFSFIQRSLHSLPGFFLLSLALVGIKQRANGKLAALIGIRTGVMTTNFLLQTGGFLRYRHDIPFWLISNHRLHPFNGVIGLSLSLALAILFFSWSQKNNISSIVQK